MTNDQPATTTRKQVGTNLIIKSFRFYDALFAAAFLYAAVRLAMAEQRPELLVLFILPPVFALAVRLSPRSLRSSRVLASLFLGLLTLGDVAAWCGLRMPASGGAWAVLSEHQRGMLGWYVLVYLAFLFVVFPPVLFVRPLLQIQRGEKPYFSRFTCNLGIVAWLLITPLVVHAIVVGLSHK
jgi:hypothetical protein